MGLNDSLNKLERSFTSEKAKKQFEKKQKTEYKHYLYKKFILLFEKNILQDPLNTYSYFINPDIKNKYIKNKFLDLPEIEKNIIYNNILNQVYKDFKNNYKYNIDQKNIFIEEEKKKKELEKKRLKILQLKYKYNYKINKLNNIKNNYNKTKKKAGGAVILALIAGGKIAEKNTSKYKKTLF